jgi:membrane associated rhomboid family serine protease
MSGILDDLKNAFSKKNNALIQLILINGIVFLSLAILYTTFYILGIKNYYPYIGNHFELSTDIWGFLYRPWTLITYGFNHANILHILFNMLAFYWFGMIFSEFLGSKKIVSLYILGVIVGGLSFISIYRFGFQGTGSLVGASAGVYAVMVGAATISPNYTLFLFLIGPVRIKYIALFYVVFSYLGLSTMNAGGALAHLAGAFMGYLYIVQLKRGNDLGKWITDFLGWVSMFFKKRKKMKVSHSQVRQKTKVTTQKGYNYHTNNHIADDYIPNEEEINAILDKIMEKGMESLTKEEKQKLQKASKK